MARDETLPFVRGNTWYGGGVIDPNNLGGVNLEGKEYKIEDLIYNTGQYITLRVVRNSGTFNLLPKRVVTFDTNYVGLRCNGYAATAAAPCLPVDELLPAAGVPPNDLFYVIIEGPCGVLAPLDGGADNVINPLDPLVSIAASSSGATTAGRVATAGTGGANLVRDQIINTIGRAVSAATTSNTNASILMFAIRWF